MRINHFKERKDVVQCYHCGIMLPRDEMFVHMEEHHVKFYSHMCGPPRPYQCSVCRRTMETEKQHAGHRYCKVSIITPVHQA